jgi:pilus assembly protein Flp/PilA
MLRIIHRVRSLFTRKSEEGASMGEYALLLALIAVALVAAITAFRNEIIGIFNSATSTLSGSNPSGS